MERLGHSAAKLTARSNAKDEKRKPRGQKYVWQIGSTVLCCPGSALDPAVIGVRGVAAA